jgi:DNA-binding IclR family transcriptional regulator
MHVASHPPGAGATDAANALGLSTPTAHNLMSALADEGLLARDAQRRFVLGPRIGVLAEAFFGAERVPRYFAAPLHALAAETSETAYLTAWRRGAIHVLDCVEGGNAVRVAGVRRGAYQAPHARASGKLLLAFARPEIREALLGEDALARLTPHTIVDRARLGDELERIRRRGWAEEQQEFAEGVACIAAPVALDGEVLAAYTVSAPVARMVARHDELLAAVRHAASDAVAGGAR